MSVLTVFTVGCHDTPLLCYFYCMKVRNRFMRYVALLAWLLCFPTLGYAEPTLSGQALIKALQQGGYNLYFRHEATDWSQYDNVRERDDWLSCDGSRMRQLSEAGRQRAKRTGEAMRQLNIPVNEVLASPYCRTMETARQLNMGDVRATDEVMNLRSASYFGGRDAIVTSARTLLASFPKPGGNRVVVAHGNVAREATPVYPVEGEAVIFKPDGQGGFITVGRIPPDLWFELSQSD